MAKSKTKMLRFRTVNVIECADTNNMSFPSLASWPDIPDGIKAAEELFKQKVKAHDQDYARALGVKISAADMEDYLEEGYYQDGYYWIGIIHSTIA